MRRPWSFFSWLQPAPVTPIPASNGENWESVADYRAAAARSLSDLETVRDRGALGPEDLPLAMCVRDEAVLIRAFLRYYRKLGVTRFMVIDTGSTDGTLEILKEADDVDLWRTQSSFAKANSGRFWIDGLLHQRARGRWILHLDADEFLVFAGIERGLKDLVGRLDALGLDRLHAPMLDVYSDRPLRETVINPDDDPLDVCPYFDNVPETIELRPVGPWIAGGVRKRLFFPNDAHSPGLTKFPLLFYTDETAYIAIHTPTPFERNDVRPAGRLMHVKLHAAFAERAQWAVREKQYWWGSWEYRQYLEVMSADPALTAFSSVSRRYTGPASLIEAGFMSEPQANAAGQKARS